MQEWFRRFAVWSADLMGSPWMFVANVVIILVWFFTGPLFRFSDTWQLVVNTGTTVFTYLAVFLIQNTQNRDAKAIHLKLDELIRTSEGARNGLVNLQELTDEELEQIHDQFEQLRAKNGGSPSQEPIAELQEDVEEELEKREEAETDTSRR